MRFEWDPKKAATNARKHGVTFGEARAIFEDPLVLVSENVGTAGGETRFIAIGMSDRRQTLVVVFTETSESIRLISARLATRAERRTYEEENP